MLRTLSEETPSKIGESVVLFGWVNARRNLGKIVFLDLRDRWGITQIVGVPAELDPDSQATLEKIRPEWVLKVEGIVQQRGAKQINPNLPTGTVEILAKKIEVLSEALTPPFEIDSEERQANEELRLKYRYLDLRHARMTHNLETRHQMIHFLRNYLTEKEKFIEVQTPILTKSTPEGARDYLVPSRVHPGKFFALPQSPQQYKQLLMVAGMDRYYQIAPCFRDEDARADRSPGEFYQLDLEMSFITQDDILNLVEKMFTEMVKKLFPEKRFTFEPWPRLDYQEVMQKYHSDKPDLRKNKEDKNELAFAWVVNFPLFMPQTKEDFFHYAGEKWAPSHHMFTAPKEEDLPLLDKDPGKVRSYQHDLVLNGFEVGGGSVRIHQPEIQEKIFDLIGFTKKQKQQFAHLLEAFRYGVPPHGGIASGIDRLISILLGEYSLKEVIAFPLNTDVRDPLMGSPSEVTEEQLKELHIRLE
ncbi:hypothetical protein AUJ78_02155 [Candidatus Peregrinibacteria bacterium CG1_02_41_10]|nr:MAG: hypothetical protein AUJ78_02155 [Candidatus Peregrinibacteria bacterium CG1_02_41_10]